MPVMKWLDTYGRHIVHCSLYSGAAVYALHLGARRNPSTTTTTATTFSSIFFNGSGGTTTFLSFLFAGVATLNLYGEIKYLLLRIGLPPGDSGLPILGHFLSWISSPRFFNCKRLLKYDGQPFTMNVFMTPWVFFTSEEDVRWVMTQERKGNLVATAPRYMMELLGLESILLQTGKLHKRLRRIMEPSFSPTAVKSYAQTVDEIVQTQLEQWCHDTTTNGGGFCLSSDSLATLALRLLFVCAFGQVPENLLSRLHTLFDLWVAGMTCWFPIDLPGNTLHKAYQARAELRTEIQNLVNDFKQKNPPGTDPTTTILEQPQIRNLLIQEVQSLSDPLDVEELKAAPLLNAFLAETWRLVPPIDTHKGDAVRDLEYKGYKIQKGVTVLIDMASDAVLNEKQFPDPTEFRIERWLNNDHPLHDPKYYLGDKVDYNLMSPKYRPFNMGAHQCLGAHFAKLEARIVITRLLQKYDIEIQNDKLNYVPLLQYSNDFKLTRRKQM